jgi:hypothetical protein
VGQFFWQDAASPVKAVILALIGLATTLSQAQAEDAPTKPRVVADALGDCFRYWRRVEYPSRGLQVLKTDFNGDGLADMAISNPRMTGTQGGWWMLYLRREDGRFTKVGGLVTKNNRFRSTTIKKGTGRLAVMIRGGPGLVVIEYYKVAHTGLNKIADEVEELTDTSPDPSRVERVFGEGYSEKPSTAYTAEWLETRYPQ